METHNLDRWKRDQSFFGRTSLLGGRGSIFGTFLGGLVMATVIQGMDYANLENWLQLVVRGSVLVLAIGLDEIAKNPPTGRDDCETDSGNK